MSRNSPFPTISSRRPRSPPPAPGSPSFANIPVTPPLAINRSRPQSPNAAPLSTSPQSFMHPARPARSERRPRQAPSIIGQSSQASISSRHDLDNSSMNGYGGRESPSSRSDARSRRTRERSDTLGSRQTDEYGDVDPYGGMESAEVAEVIESPKALSAVVAAFQQAGSSRRRGTVGSDGLASDRERERRREKERRERAKEKERRNRSKATGDIDAVLNDVKEEWADVLEEDFNPVTLALSLLDESSAGRDMRSFSETKHSLERALKGSVDKYYPAFAHALPHHANLSNSLTKAQAEISEARSHLIESRDALGNKRADLVQLWSRGQTLEEMMRLLDEIERLKAVPDILESLISEKRLLQAAILLVKSLKLISKSDMLEIGAVADLRSYLTAQESALRDILLDELHSHLYLKTFWCDRRWSSYVPSQTTFPHLEFDRVDITGPAPLSAFSGSSSPQSRLERFLTHLTLRSTNSSPLELHDDSVDFGLRPGLDPSASISSYNKESGTISTSGDTPQVNPENDSFTYIETLLEALAVLGKLVNALDTVVQRLPVEVYNLVETTIEEVSDRSDLLRGGKPEVGPVNSASSPSNSSPVSSTNYMFIEKGATQELSTALRLAALEALAKETDHETLRDLFWTLYSKLNAVLQGFRVTYEVANRIGRRRDFKDSSGVKPGALFPLVEIWTPLQTEVSALLTEYLRTDDQASISGRNPIASINEVLRAGASLRDKSKPVFRFSDTDAKLSAKILRKHDEELSRVLKETVPGLVNGPAENAASNALSTVGVDDRFAGAGQHRLLIKPDAFHVSVLFQPTLAWLDSVSSTLPPSTSVPAPESHTMLNDFVLNVYLPQLEEKVLTLFHQAVNVPDAFHEDPGWKVLSPQPLVKASTHLIALINSLCAMMRVTPFHRENYSRLILGVIVQFYQKCNDRFQNLTTRNNADAPSITDAPQWLTPSAWAQRPEVNSCLFALFATSDEEAEKQRSLCKLETQLEFDWLAGKSLEKDDTLGSPHKIAALANLYHSLVWFVAQLTRLRLLSEEAQSPSLGSDVPNSASLQAPLISNAPPQPPSFLKDDELRLPLTRAMIQRFDALIKIYDQLTELVLYTIRLDMRCRTYHALQMGMRQDEYRVDREAQEPDLYIVDLNVELAACDDVTSSNLAERERRFIFQGLGYLMEQLLISEARNIRFANQLGIRKITRNIMALQQGLKAIDVISQDTDFERARAYYSLFVLTPTKMLDTVRRRPEFTFDEYKAMLNLQVGIDQSLGDDAPEPAGSDYQLHLIDLQALTISDE